GAVDRRAGIDSQNAWNAALGRQAIAPAMVGDFPVCAPDDPGRRKLLPPLSESNHRDAPGSRRRALGEVGSVKSDLNLKRKYPDWKNDRENGSRSVRVLNGSAYGNRTLYLHQFTAVKP